MTIDTSSRAIRKQYAERVAARSQEFARICRSANVDTIEVRTDGRYVDPLIRFFRQREMRSRR
jgi:uncharacterized protein (DUF58 family)